MKGIWDILTRQDKYIKFEESFDYEIVFYIEWYLLNKGNKTEERVHKGKAYWGGGESDWRKGKYAYAISAIIAFIHDIDNNLDIASGITGRIALTVTYIHNSNFAEGTTVNSTENDKYKCVDTTRTTENTRFVEKTIRLLVSD